MRRIALALPMAFSSCALNAEEQPASTPVWMMVAHEVKDYDAWRAIFDGALSTRQSAGEVSFEIDRYPGQPNHVIAIFRWDSADRARAFVDDPFVRNAMRAAGVTSPPVVIFHNDTGGFDRDQAGPVSIDRLWRRNSTMASKTTRTR